MVNIRTSEEVEESAVPHELRDDVDGLLLRGHGVQLQQLRMTQALQHLGLRQEVLRVHLTCGRSSGLIMCYTDWYCKHRIRHQGD